MQKTLNPLSKAGIAIIGTSVLAAAPLVAPTTQDSLRHASQTVASMAVNPAGVVEDLLSDIATLSISAGAASQILLGTAGRLPLYGASALAAIMQDPSETLSVLSALTYLTWSPDPVAPPVGPFGPDSLVRLLNQYALAPAVALLPPALQDAVNSFGGALADIDRTLLGLLPDPDAGFDALSDAYHALPASVYQAVNDVSSLYQNGFGQTALNLSVWAGAVLPGLVLANAAQAVQAPSEIPGLVSALVYSVFSPAPSATFPVPSFYSSFTPIVDQLIDVLGAPFGGADGLVATASSALADITTNVLSLLPDPIVAAPVLSSRTAAAKPAPDTAVAESVAVESHSGTGGLRPRVSRKAAPNAPGAASAAAKRATAKKPASDSSATRSVGRHAPR